MKKYNSGFTLVEIITATFMFAVIAGGVAVFGAYYFKNYSFSFEETQSVNMAQQALTTMIREIREARSADDGAWPLNQTDDNTLIFYSDVTNDGRTDRVRYFIENHELKKGVIEPTQVPVTYPIAQETIKTIAYFVDNNGAPLFTYYNGNWPTSSVNNPLPISSRVLNTRFVQIYLRINITQDASAQPYELTSGVQIRSLKNNL
jgi:type II secretory pathway component PulJ